MFEKFQNYIEATGHWNGIMLAIILTCSGIFIGFMLYYLLKKDKKKPS